MATAQLTTNKMMEKMAELTETRRPKTFCQNVCAALTLTPKGATPVNHTVLFTVVIALFGSAYSITFLFPFLPEMVLYFGYVEEDKGYYAGYIASGMFAGRVFGSYFWGWMSDKYGRRPIILLTTLAVGATNIAFGFSTDLTMAVATRFINGLFNGLVGTCKTVLYEISDDTNQAAGMSAIAMAWGGGVVLGPLISGFLAQPSSMYPAMFPEGSLFHSFPFLLPSIVAFFMSVIGFVVVLLKLPETLPSKCKLQRNEESDVDDNKVAGDALLEHSKELKKLADTGDTTGNSQAADSLEEAPSKRTYSRAKSMYQLQHYAHNDDYFSVYYLGGLLITSSSEHCTKLPAKSMSLPQISDTKMALFGEVPQRSMELVPMATENTGVLQQSEVTPVDKLVKTPAAGAQVTSTCCSSLKKTTLCRLLQERDVLISVLLYTILSFAVIGWEELFIIWASTELRLGGLNLSSSRIGAAVGAASTGLLFIQVFLYPRLVRRFGTLKVFQGAGVYLIFVSAVMPSVRYLYHDQIAMWVLLLSMTGVQKLSVTSAFSSVSIFINNSVLREDAGSVNGIAMTMSAVGRTCAPVIIGSMFAWSITSGVKIGFPFDVNMAFIFLAFNFLVINFASAFIPNSLEKQKKRFVINDIEEKQC